MREISENLLQYIWRHRLVKPLELIGTKGEVISVTEPGELNRDSGPDFSNASIVIDGVRLSGNIEVHTRSSHWLKHGHQHDPAYDRIILHVVYVHDEEIRQNILNGVAVLELKDYIEDRMLESYAALSNSNQELPCVKLLTSVPDPTFETWLEQIGMERMMARYARLEKQLALYKGNYHEVLYANLLSNFGFKVNAVPFELLARSLPLNVLLRHADHLLHAEALLFGCAGLLDEQLSDPYLRNLQNEFEFLRKKYKLCAQPKSLLKFSRLRPANFPTLRLAQFAAMVHSHPDILGAVMSFTCKEEIVSTLCVNTSDYWKNHYSPDGDGSPAELRLGQESAENILINTFAPFYYFYGRKFSKPQYCDLAFRILKACKAENNRKTRYFRNKRHLLKNAEQSQGAIELFNHYCERKRCLECEIGKCIITSAASVKEPELQYA